jgi:DNA-binding CsgD family transcriptional regulator
MVLAGQPRREVARALGIGETTVKTHLKGALDKLGVERVDDVRALVRDLLAEDAEM